MTSERRKALERQIASGCSIHDLESLPSSAARESPPKPPRLGLTPAGATSPEG